MVKLKSPKKKSKPVADVIATQAAKTVTKKFTSHYHYEHEIEFPDGVVVMGSSLDNLPRIRPPQRGLYADHHWRPAWRSEFITWNDFGLPKNYEAALDAICDTYDLAEQGARVEIGCQGGHGRTGTILACMAVVSGMDHKDAIAFVRSRFCSQAVETDEQEWWVEWFQCYLDDTVPSEKPLDWISYVYQQNPGFKEKVLNGGNNPIYKEGKLPV